MDQFDETKEVRLTRDEMTILRTALDNYIAENRFAATLNDEFRQRQERRESLRDKLYRLGIFESNPFTFMVRVEQGGSHNETENA